MPLVAIVRHQIQPGQLDAAAQRVNGNGERMAAQPGFVSRQLLQPIDGSDTLVTITVWESAEHYEAWTEHNRAANVHAGKPSPFIGSNETLLLEPYAES
jgi:heme-degrading monooxygenase HmoA